MSTARSPLSRFPRDTVGKGIGVPASNACGRLRRPSRRYRRLLAAASTCHLPGTLDSWSRISIDLDPALAYRPAAVRWPRITLISIGLVFTDGFHFQSSAEASGILALSGVTVAPKWPRLLDANDVLKLRPAGELIASAASRGRRRSHIALSSGRSLHRSRQCRHHRGVSTAGPSHGGAICSARSSGRRSVSTPGRQAHTQCKFSDRRLIHPVAQCQDCQVQLRRRRGPQGLIRRTGSSCRRARAPRFAGAGSGLSARRRPYLSDVSVLGRAVAPARRRFRQGSWRPGRQVFGLHRSTPETT